MKGWVGGSVDTMRSCHEVGHLVHQFVDQSEFYSRTALQLQGDFRFQGLEEGHRIAGFSSGSWGGLGSFEFLDLSMEKGSQLGLLVEFLLQVVAVRVVEDEVLGEFDLEQRGLLLRLLDLRQAGFQLLLEGGDELLVVVLLGIERLQGKLQILQLLVFGCQVGLELLEFGLELLRFLGRPLELLREFCFDVVELAALEDEFVVLGLQLFVPRLELQVLRLDLLEPELEPLQLILSLCLSGFESCLSCLLLLQTCVQRCLQFTELLLEGCFLLYQGLSQRILLTSHPLQLACQLLVPFLQLLQIDVVSGVLLLEFSLHPEELILEMGEEALLGVAEVLILEVDLVSLLDDLSELLVVLLPQILVPLLLPQQGVDQFAVGSLEVLVRPLSLLQQLVAQVDFAQFDRVDGLGEVPPSLLRLHELAEVLLVLPVPNLQILAVC